MPPRLAVITSTFSWVGLGFLGLGQAKPDLVGANPAKTQPDVGLGQFGLGKTQHINKHRFDEVTLNL
jgi:hypothetical protein